MSLTDDFKNVFRKPNNGLMQLIVINLVVFVLINILGWLIFFNVKANYFKIISEWLSIPTNLKMLLFRPWTWITYMFMHADIFHLLFNMLVFYWFGRIFHEFLGNKRLIGVYFLGGFSGAILYLLAYNSFPYFQTNNISGLMIGASASVMAILVATATKLPDYSMRLLLFGNVRLKYIALALFVLDIISAPHGNSGGHFAHIGGAIFGFIYIKELDKGRDLTNGFNRLVDWIITFFTKSNQAKSKMKVEYRKPKKPIFQKNKKQSTTASNLVSQLEIDKILDKISESGYENLTAKEKELLFKASNKNT